MEDNMFLEAKDKMLQQLYEYKDADEYLQLFQTLILSDGTILGEWRQVADSLYEDGYIEYPYDNRTIARISNLGIVFAERSSFSNPLNSLILEQ